MFSNVFFIKVNLCCLGFEILKELNKISDSYIMSQKYEEYESLCDVICEVT